MEHRHSNHPVDGRQLNHPKAEHGGPHDEHNGHQPHGTPGAGTAARRTTSIWFTATASTPGTVWRCSRTGSG